MKMIAGAMMAFISLSAMASVNVKAIQEKLQTEKAQWTAGKTWVSELPEEQVKRMLGSNSEVPNNLDYSDVYSKSATYESVDWRNMNGVNWLGPVMNQGNCGSCVAFATIATLEAQISITNQTSWLKPRLSPQALFACGGGSCDRGWFPSSAASYIKKKGVVDNACAPYTMGSTGEDVACTQFCQNQADRTIKVAGSNSPSGWFGSAAKVKEALKKGPLITTMTVYEDFLTYTGGIYKSTSGRNVGGHAVSLVGYNDEGRYWIVRNSWGEDWGEKGFVRVSWDDKSGIGSDTIALEVNPSSVVSIASPAENEYVSGEINVKLDATRSEDYTVTLMKSGRSVMNAADHTINTLGLEDGKYELVATTTSGAKSLVRGFTVLNSTPEATINFAAIDYDLNQPLKDRIEFNVAIDAKPVNLQTLSFMVTKLDGTVVAQRTTDVALAKNKLGFRFNSIPNGQYLIFFRGKINNMVFDSAKIKVQTQN